MPKSWTDPERIPQILELVERIWRIRPDMRLGQIISTAYTLVETNKLQDIYRGGDDELLEGLTLMLRFVEDHRSRG